jgi:hypothetical protein
MQSQSNVPPNTLPDDDSDRTRSLDDLLRRTRSDDLLRDVPRSQLNAEETDEADGTPTNKALLRRTRSEETQCVTESRFQYLADERVIYRAGLVHQQSRNKEALGTRESGRKQSSNYGATPISASWTELDAVDYNLPAQICLTQPDVQLSHDVKSLTGRFELFDTGNDPPIQLQGNTEHPIV